MAKEYALVKNGVVVNRIVADAKFVEAISGQYDLVTDDPEAAKGRLWDGHHFSDPEPSQKQKGKTITDIINKLADIEAKIDGVSASAAQKAGG